MIWQNGCKSCSWLGDGNEGNFEKFKKFDKQTG